jgi:hypothetical protein
LASQNELGPQWMDLQSSSFKPPPSTPGMHQKLTEDGKDFMQNNTLPTKTLVKLKDNSDVLKI